MDATRLRCSSMEEQQPKREELLDDINDCICVSYSSNTFIASFVWMGSTLAEGTLQEDRRTNAT
jgi:hypothetical protein